MAVALLTAASLGLLFAVPARSDSRPQIQIGISSQQAGPGRATVQARIAARHADPGGHAERGEPPVARAGRFPVKGSADDDRPEPYPALDADSAFARDSTPVGPGSFWYPPVGGDRVCVYIPDTVAPCYRLVGGPGSPVVPGLDPTAMAASVAERLPLLPGRIRMSPPASGLAGAVSWFWLDPAPRTEELTVLLAGETVTVSAEPSGIEWRFGDGANLSGGPGVPYRSGKPPTDAVVHIYETRCLPGDQGRNPYVLGSCAAGGYRVEAVVVWRITFRAVGPVDASGSLPTRSTAAEVVYPVSEARGFVVPGGSS